MGIPFRSYFGAIVALQLGSLAGFVWLIANQYQLQNQLWQIQTQLEIPGNIKLQTKGFETLASGSGDPSGGPSPVTGVEASESELGAVGVGTGDLIDWIAGSWIFSDTSRTSWRRRHSPITEGSEGSCSKAACRSQTEETCLWSGGEYWLNTMWVDPGCIMNVLWPSGFEMKPMWW